MTAAAGRVGGVVLAAGGGRRIGGPKALLRVDGRLLVDRAVEVLRDGGCGPVVVVLGADAAAVVAAATLPGAVVVVNDGWAEGIGSSLRTALRVMTDLPVEAALMTLVDQPGVGAPSVERIRAAAAQADPTVDAVVATYRGRPSHPVLLRRAVWEQVCRSAGGDIGARAWLRQHPQRVTEVACDDLGTPDDIDTPDDLRRLAEEHR